MLQERMLPIDEILDNVLDLDFFIPFFIIFLLTYAVLQSFKVLSEKKSINVLIAVIIGLFFVNNQKMVDIFNNFFPNISAAILILLGLLLILGFILGKKMYKGWIFIWIMAVSLVSIWWYVNDKELAIIEDYISWMHYELALVILLGILIVWILTREPKKKEKKKSS